MLLPAAMEQSIPERLFALPEAAGRPALTAQAAGVDFAGLRSAALRLAGRLRAELNLQPGERVALCLPKSLEAVEAIHGVLAAGAAYVPLPVGGPPARLAAMLRMIRPRLLLTTGKVARILAGVPGQSAGSTGAPQVWAVDPLPDGRGLAGLLDGAMPLSAPARVGPDDPAAIFFTSGSTGVPKGVLWSQACLARTLDWIRRRSAMDARDCLLSLASLQYTTALDIFCPLAAGARVHLLTEREAQFPDLVLERARRERVTIWSSTATALRRLLEDGRLAKGGLESLRRVEFFGEPLAVPQLRELMALLPQARFFNIYGATEAYDMLSCELPRPLPDDMEAIPLGLPSGANRFAILDESGRPAAAGAAGEICVFGDRVMAGYWDDPALTRARRVEDRLDSYRSGDLGYLGPDGLVRLVGRQDNVVKLRGHRFDLGEIEAVLKSHPAVSDAIAVASPTALDATHVLAAILAADADRIRPDLDRACRERLPRFACPVRYIAFAAFPLLASGKVDRTRVERSVLSPTG